MINFPKTERIFVDLTDDWLTLSFNHLESRNALTEQLTNEIRSIVAIIKKDKKTTPNDLKLDFKFKICFVEIIKPANIHSCVKKIIGIIRSGVTAKNLRRPGEWAKPTAIKIFLNISSTQKL